MDREPEKPDLSAICLQNAVLCADCEMISDSPHDACLVCGSRSLLSLSRVLGGTLPVQRTRLLFIGMQPAEFATPSLVLSGPPPHKRPRRRVHAHDRTATGS